MTRDTLQIYRPGTAINIHCPGGKAIRGQIYNVTICSDETPSYDAIYWKGEERVRVSLAVWEFTPSVDPDPTMKIGFK